MPTPLTLASLISVLLAGGSPAPTASVAPAPMGPPPPPSAQQAPQVTPSEEPSLLPWQGERVVGPLAHAQEDRRGRRVYLVPTTGCQGSYDLVVHFHGAPKHVVPAFKRSSLGAVAVVINLGQLSGPYEQAFAGVDSFPHFLDSVKKDLAAQCGNATLGRVAITSWSGGYGAAYRILAREANQERVDAVLFSDGLHASLANKSPRVIHDSSLDPYTRFAAKAARGEKLMAIAHSEIMPPTYVSSKESASFLLEKQGTERQAMTEAGPREGMRLTSRAQVGGLRVLGFAGNGPDAHCDHLFAFGDVMLPQLERHWARP